MFMKESTAKILVCLVAGAIYLLVLYILYSHRYKNERNFGAITKMALELSIKVKKNPDLFAGKMSTWYEPPGKLMVFGKVPNELALERLKKIINESALPFSVYWQIEIGPVEDIEKLLKEAENKILTK